VKNNKYSRILLKLSGEALQGGDGCGINTNILNNISQQITAVHNENIQIGIVIGAGNIFRGVAGEKTGIKRTTADNMGMLATMINVLALSDNLQNKNVPTKIMSSFSVPALFDRFNATSAINFLKQQNIVIFAGGTGNPFFSTDSAAAMRAIEINAELLLKVTKVDGVYDKDPVKFSNTKKYDKITYDMVLEKNITVMDHSAILLCKDFNMPLRVASMVGKNSLLDIIYNDKIGTTVYDK
jgi:uridylate kinase